MEYIKNIYKYSSDKTLIGGAAEGGASVFFVAAHVFFYIMNIHGYSFYIPYMFHVYVLNIFHIVSLGVS